MTNFRPQVDSARGGGVGPNGGARYHIWFRTTDQALDAVERIDCAEMPGKLGRGQKAAAALDLSVSIMLRSDEYSAVGEEIEAHVRASASGQSAEGFGVTVKIQKLKRRDVRITISGDDVRGITGVYRQIRKLQLGFSLPIGPDSREKVFPADRRRRQKVQTSLKGLARKHKCMIIPLFATSTLRVVGATAKVQQLIEGKCPPPGHLPAMRH